MGRRKELAVLLGEFTRIGAFTFGGGWSIIAQMQQLYVDKKKTITAEELMDLVGVAKSLPGTMIANVAMLYGYRVNGLMGGLAAVTGMCMPPLVVMIAVSYFYNAFRENHWVNAVMMGMQAAVVPIIVSAAIGLMKGSVKYPPCVLVVLGCMGVYLVADVNPALLVLIGVISGLVIGGYYERKEGLGNGAA